MADGEILTQGPPGLLPISESLDPSLLRIQGSQPWRESFDRAMGLGLAFGPGAIQAWHGTPHTFEQFSNEAIGTGQGAQSYGYGHYVAGARATGEHYQEMLAGKPQWMVETESGKMSIPERLKLLDWSNKLPGAQWSTEELSEYNALKNFSGWHDWFNTQGSGVDEADLNHIIEEMSQNAPKAAEWMIKNGDRLSFVQPGHLLEVHVRPEEHELLDWDQPNSEDITKKFDALYRSKFEIPAPSVDGFDLYQDLTSRLGSAEAASRALHEAGIPGIKYLDESSRRMPPDHPNATHNYVIFDPSNLVIRSRDGIEMTPVEGDPFAPTR